MLKNQIRQQPWGLKTFVYQNLKSICRLCQTEKNVEFQRGLKNLCFILIKHSSNQWKFKTLLLLKVVWDPESLFWVLKSEEEDFHLKLNLMGSFWRFVFVMNGKLPVFGMPKSESFFYCSQSIPDFENLKDFEQLCFGLHTCFTGVKQ